MEREQRARVVRAARSWLRTPYHHGAQVKGAGVDCAQILIAVYAEADLIEAFDPGYYPPDWHLHRDEERYLATVERLARRRLSDDEVPEPGDVVVWRIGRCFAHGGIVTAWPRVVHAYALTRVVEETDVSTDGQLMVLKSGAPRETRFYSLWDRA